MDELEVLARTRGAAGVRAFLRDRRLDAPVALDHLAELVPLLPTAAGAIDLPPQCGVRLEKWALRAQRELWTALASASTDSVPLSSSRRLALAFLTCAARRPSDSVCASLARIVAERDASCEPTPLLTSDDKPEPVPEITDVDDGGEVWREIERLTFHRAVFGRATLPSDGDDSGRSDVDDDGVATPAEWLVHDNQTLAPRAGDALEAATPTKKPRLMALPSDGAQRAAMSVAEPTAEVPSLPKELESRAVAVAKPLAQLARSDPQPTREAINETVGKATKLLLEIVNDVHATHTASEHNFHSLCTLLQLEATSDEALFHIATALVDSNFSSRYAAVFIAASVLPKIQRASSIISRLLLQTALLFGSRYGSILIDSVLLPLLSGDAAKCLKPPQAEAITRILRGENAVPAASIDEFVRRALEAANLSARGGLPSQLTSSAATDASLHLLTNDSALLVFQNVFSGRPALTEATVEQFVAACEYALDGPGGDKLPGSLKFATALFTLISKYPEQCSPHVEALEAITKRLSSLMAKTTMRFLLKLKK